jgi:hypothetical protein
MHKNTYLRNNMIAIKRFLTLFIFLLTFVCMGKAYAQVTGDYQTTATTGARNWTNTGDWETWNGTAWVAATSYPGQLAPGTNQTVTIRGTVNMTLPISPIENIGNLNILDATGTRLTIAANMSLRRQGTLTNVNATSCPACATRLFQVNDGDYRSGGSGNWSNFTVYWQVFDMAFGIWTTASGYPGQNPPLLGQQVFIPNASNMSLDISPANVVGNLIIENGGNISQNGCAKLQILGALTNFSSTIPADRFAVINAGDYRTTGGGTGWNDVNAWEKYDGTNWVTPAPDYPGQIMPFATQDVIMLHNMTTNVTIPAASNIGDLFIASGVTLTATSNAIAVRVLKNCGTIITPTNVTSAIVAYRSVGTGNWSNVANWQIDTGSGFAAATDYPGSGEPSATQVVNILAGHTVTLDLTPPEDIGALAGAGNLTISGTNTLRRRGSNTLSGTCTSGCANVIALNNGDYRNFSSGNWSSVGNWQKYNGTTWAAAPDYPGQNPTGTTQRVFVKSGSTVLVDITPANEIGNNFLIENGAILQINSCENLKVFTNTTVFNGNYSPNSGTITTINTNDFRSVGSGNWSNNATWQKFDGTAWVAAGAGEYPGLNATFAGRDVFIRTGHTVSLDVTPAEDVQNFVIEGGTFTINGNFNVRYRGTFVNCLGTYNPNSGGSFPVRTGDFRSTGSGNWNNAVTWQRYNGTAWVAVTVGNAPGQASAMIAGHIFIRPTHTITTIMTVPNNIFNLVIENASTLTINTAVTINASAQVSILGTLNQIGTGVINYQNAGDYRTRTFTAADACFSALLSGTDVNGDYRTRAGGNWNNNNTWQVRSGGAWVNCAAGDYPGVATMTSGRVLIRNGHAVTLNITPNSLFNLQVQTGGSLALGASRTLSVTNAFQDQNGTPTVTGTGTLIANSWNNPCFWQKFSGTAWVDATDYPGQNASTNPPRVLIRANHWITTNITPFHDLQTVSIATNGRLNFIGTMNVNATTLRLRTAASVSGSCAACATNAIVLANGDYRSVASAGWGVASTWERYNGSSWVAATEYPGQTTAPASNTQRVFVRTSHTVTLALAPCEDIGLAFIERAAALVMPPIGSSGYSLRARTAMVNNGTFTANGGSYITLTNGDLRSAATGAWGTTGTWQQFNGTTWAALGAGYPGSIAATANKNVYVRCGHTVTLDVNPPEDLGNLLVEQGSNIDATGCFMTTVAGNASFLGTVTVNPKFDGTDQFIKVKNGDYRTTGAGINWNVNANWQRFNGTTWAVVDFPGAAAPVNGQNIVLRHDMDFNVAPLANPIINVFVLSGATLTKSAGGTLQVLGRNLSSTLPGGTGNQCGTAAFNDPASAGTISYASSNCYCSNNAGGGNWSNPADWGLSTDDCATISGAATDYPGQNPAGTTPSPGQKVYIRSGFPMTVNITPAEDIRQLIVNAGGVLNFPNTAGVGHNLKVWASGVGGSVGVINNGTINNINNITGITGTITPLFTGSTITFIETGDYRTASSAGSWTDVNTWQVFNSSQRWVSVTGQVPGQFAPLITQSVIVRTGSTIDVDISMPTTGTSNVANLIIENGSALNTLVSSNISIRQHLVNHGTLGTLASTNGSVTFASPDNSIVLGASDLANYNFYNFVAAKTSTGTVTTSRDFKIKNNFLQNGTGTGTFTASSPSTIWFDGDASQEIGGTSTSLTNVFHDIQVDLGSTELNITRPITVTNDLDLTNNAKVNNTGTVNALSTLSNTDGLAGSQFINATGGTLNYSGATVPFANQTNKLIAIANNNSVLYNRNGAQGVYPTNYFNLNIGAVGITGTKTLDVGTANYEVTGTLSLSGNGTIFEVNGTTGRLLNLKTNIGVGTKYIYNANANTTGVGNLPNYNGPGSSADNYASNFSGRFNSINISNHAGNSISSSNLNDIRFNLGTVGGGSAVYAVRNATPLAAAPIPDVPNAAVVRFDIVGSINDNTTASVASMLVGSGFTDDAAISGTIAGRLDFNFRSNNEMSVTTSSAGSTAINNTVIGNFSSNTGSRRKRITWVINTTGGSINYTTPSGSTDAVPANTMDVWDGTNRVANNILVINNGATINALKILLTGGGTTNSFTLENIKINPLALLTTNNYVQGAGTAVPDFSSAAAAAANVGGFNQTPSICLPVGQDYAIASISGSTPAYFYTESSASFVYNPNNQFIVQLSRPDGSFSSFTTIGTLNATTLNNGVPLVIPATILPALASGTGFRMRVVSTDPPMVSQSTPTNLSISSATAVQFVGGTVASPITAALPAIQAITTTSPNQLSLRTIVAGNITGTYQWKVRKVITVSPLVYGGTYDIAGATTKDFQADGTKTNNAMISGQAGIHFHEDIGLYDLFCEITGGACSPISTQPVRIAVECAGCTKNPRPDAACATNLVFNGTFELGTNATPGVGGSGSAVYPSSVPDPNDPDSEGVIPFDGSGGYGLPNPAIIFASNTYNVYNKTYTSGDFSYLTTNSNFRFNTPYGFSTEYGGTNNSNFNVDMGLESTPANNTCSCTMCPENTWSVTTNPGLYHGNFCDANGTDNCWRGSRAAWTSDAPSSGSAGVPFINFPTKVSATSPASIVTQFPAAPNGTYNSSPSGNRMLLANGSPFSAGKMWAQRFKVRKNTDYVFSFWAANMNDIQAIYGLFANCTQIGNNLNLNGAGDRCVWRQYTFLWNSGELSTVEFSIRNVSTIRSGNDFAVDDIMFYRCTANTNFFPTPNKFVWRGFNTDWFNADNWGNCVIPDCDSDVIIPATSTNPAAQTASGGQTYYLPVLQNSNATLDPNPYPSGHPALNTSNARNINTDNLASVRSITIEYGASFNGLPVPSVRFTSGWNLNVCGNFTNAKDQTIPVGIQQGVRADAGSSITFTAISPTQQPLTATITGNWINDAGGNNSFANVIIRKKSVNQVVQMQDDIDVTGNFAIVDGGFDVNEKYMTFGGDNFVNGLTGATPTVGNLGNATDIAGNVLYFATDLENTTIGASFDHGNGTVEFSKSASSVGNQNYYRTLLAGCTTCQENFYNLVINELGMPTAQDVNLRNRSMFIENTLSLTRGNMLSTVSGAKEIYLKNPSPTNSLLASSAGSYIVTTNTGFTPTEANLKFRREVDNVGTYDFPVGGTPSGNASGAPDYRLLSMTLTQRFPNNAGSVIGYFDTRDADVFPTVKTPPNSTLVPCSGSSPLYSFQFCTGGYWDLKPLGDNGSEVALGAGVSYNLTMPSIPANFGCAGTVITFMKRSNDAGEWGYDNSCFVSASTRNGFTSFSKIAPISDLMLLPVEFLSFDAFKNNQTVDVKWETVSERNSSHFIVQRSTDNTNFVAMGRVEAKGTTLANTKYLFNDAKPNRGINYYRLLQVDLDGKETFTKIVAINFDGELGELQVFPNPSSEGVAFNVILPTERGNEVEIKMTDAIGKQVFFQRFKFEGGIIQLPADFAKGFYTLTIATPKENYVRKLVIK